jgi:hypothetical protein
VCSVAYCTLFISSTVFYLEGLYLLICVYVYIHILKYIHIKKGKVVPVLNLIKHYAIKAYGGVDV